MTAVSVDAQSFDKGDWFLGAQSTGLDIIHRFTDGSSGTDFDLSFGSGLFLADKLAIDVMTGIDYVKVKDADGVGAINFGAGVRYYPVGNLFARLGYNGQARFHDGKLVSYLDAKVGYDIFLSEKVFFEPAVYYEKRTIKGGENILGLSIGIGVRF